MKLKRINVILLLVLFISVGFAVLTSNLSINGIASFSDASFDVHFENASVSDESVEGGNIVINDGNVSINITGSFEKPGDYINTSFYVINSGTMDATLNTFSISGINSTYFTSTMKYDIDGTNVAKGNILRAGQGRKINFHLEYKYDVEQLTTATSLNATVTMNYINPKKVTSTTVWDYEYTGGEQTFYVNKAGNYKLEVWGAQGGSMHQSSPSGGYGGYSTGQITLSKATKLYVYVGGEGSKTCTGLPAGTCSGGYNGGGGSSYSSSELWGAGGGASHIATSSGLLNTFSNKIEDLIIVAGGGGGAYNSSGASAGGYKGMDGLERVDFTQATGGTQSSGGAGSFVGTFGQGGICEYGNCTGGGGGFYGGGGTTATTGAGGSSYIGNDDLTNKVMYCRACEEHTTSTNPEDFNEDWYTISTYNISANATSNYVKIGDGYVRITYLGK